jgi:hypothetical protein
MDQLVEMLGKINDLQRELAATKLSLRTGVVYDVNGADPSVVTLIVGGTIYNPALIDNPAVLYTNVPTLTSVAKGDVVYWVQTGSGTGLILGAKGSNIIEAPEAEAIAVGYTTMPLTGTSWSLTVADASIPGSAFSLSSDSYPSYVGRTLQARFCVTVSNCIAGDNLMINVMGYAPATLIIPDVGATAPNEFPFRMQTGWNAVPSVPWQGFMQIRNLNAARGSTRSAWVELRYA